jgi:16S rRNA (cytidine1402-2'-O)-methyltransferase
MAELDTPVDHPNEVSDPSQALEPSKLEPALYVVATPIGNLGDVTERARATLAAADAVLCEDTRVTGRLLGRLGLKRPMLVYNDHNAARARPGLLDRLQGGQVLALVSDAGTPCISDPGYKLVREALAAGIPVRAVPGPSSAIAALSVSGLPTDRFLFLGFLPSRRAARRNALAEVAGIRATLVLFEAPGRLAALLDDAAELLGEREAVVARELTKLFEEQRRGKLGELAAIYAEGPPPRGEIVVVIGPGQADVETDQGEVDRLLESASATLPPRRAASAVAEATGRPANELYARLLELRRHGQDH